MKYQFRVDGRAFGNPVRDRWEDAAQDAVNAGLATWVGCGKVALNDAAGAEIERIEDDK